MRKVYKDLKERMKNLKLVRLLCQFTMKYKADIKNKKLSRMLAN